MKIREDLIDPRILRLVNFMKANLGRRLTERELADEIHVTPQHLCALFKNEVGETPVRYLNQLRMEKARELLQDSQASAFSVKEIAATVGCHDVSHFVRDFQKKFGLSPRRYRAQSQSANNLKLR